MSIGPRRLAKACVTIPIILAFLHALAGQGRCAEPTAKDLLRAIRAKDAATVSALLRENELLAHMREDGTNLPAVVAIDSAAGVDIVTSLLDARIPVDSKNSRGETLLWLALKTMQPDITGLLVERGASLSVRGADGDTPGQLMLAAPSGEVAGGHILDVLKHAAKQSLSEDLQLARDALGVSLPLNPGPGGEGEGKERKALLTGFMDTLRKLRANQAHWTNKARMLECWIAAKGPLEPPEELLASAVTVAPTGILKTLLDAGLKPDQTVAGTTALCLAISCGNEEAALLLLQRGASTGPSRDDPQKRTALVCAARVGSMRMAEALLAAGADANESDFAAKNPKGNGPLFHALDQGHDDIALFLLKKGASPRRANLSGQTPLNLAAMNGCTNTFNHLLGLGVNVEAADEAGYTALLSAAEHGRLGFVRALVDHDADIQARAKQGRTALAVAAGSGNSDLLAFLVEKGLDPSQTGDGEIALCNAVGVGAFESVKLLWKRGARPRLPASEPAFSPLHFASSLGIRGLRANPTTAPSVRGKRFAPTGTPEDYARIVKFLVEEAGLGVRDRVLSNGEEPLHSAAKGGDTNIVAFLINRGADVKAANKWGITPLLDAVECNHAAACRFLLEHGSDITVRMRLPGRESFDIVASAVAAGAVDALEVLLKSGASPHVRMPKGETMLMVATSMHRVAMLNASRLPEEAVNQNLDLLRASAANFPRVARVLLKAGVDPRIEHAGEGDALAYALRSGDAEIVSILLDHRVPVDGYYDLNVKNEDGSRGKELRVGAIHLACEHMPAAIVARMIRLGADPRRLNGNGISPLQYATMHDTPENLDLLVGLGVPVDLPGSNGTTPLQTAVWTGRINAARSLLKLGADPRLRDKQGRDSFELARMRNNPEMLALLQSQASLKNSEGR